MLKAGYGLQDAPRKWFYRLKSELKCSGSHVSSFDECFFTWFDNGTCSGVIPLHADDLLWEGTQLFYKSVIGKISNKLEIKSLSSFPCRYLDIDINKLENAGFCVDLRHYSDCFSKISVADSQKDYLESFSTIKQYKFASKQLGKMLWMSKQTVSILSFTVADFLT